VSIQNVGEISVSGIEAATQKIKAAMSKVYSTIGSGQSSCCQSESHQNDSSNYNRSRQPGNYSISSLATV
jgi:hypothetical protein